MSNESGLETISMIATAFAAIVALCSWFTARSSRKIAKESLEIAQESRDLAKREYEAKVDDFSVEVLDAKKVINEKELSITVYVRLSNKSSVSSSLVKVRACGHFIFPDESEDLLDMEYSTKDNIEKISWNNTSYLLFPLSFGERQGTKGYFTVKLPKSVIESSYLKKITFDFISSQDTVYSVNYYGL